MLHVFQCFLRMSPWYSPEIPAIFLLDLVSFTIFLFKINSQPVFLLVFNRLTFFLDFSLVFNFSNLRKMNKRSDFSLEINQFKVILI